MFILQAVHILGGLTSRPQRGEEIAVNVIDQTSHIHHPVMLAVPYQVFPLEKDYIVELNGLYVPAKFDCDIFNNGAHWGTFGTSSLPAHAQYAHSCMA